MTDNFKSVNDSFGHGVGDEVIKYVANQANSLMKKGQTLARIGGEEFAIVAYFNTSEEALNFAEQIISTIKNHSLMAFPTIKGITVSMGVAYYSYYRKTDELTLADDALYKAKTAGKDRVEMTVI
ncbi:GGDEF domain-containing protein [Vibrio ordalii]|uniref:GGDEF domain-containing protein n=2 Tax=Vibrio ordalii TaxID=28174 RepID=UPI0039E861BF